MSPTQKQQKSERDARKSHHVAISNVIVAVAALIVSALSSGWQFYSARQQRASYDKEIGNIATSLRVLTAAVAPQLQKAIDDSLASSLTPNPINAVKALTSVASQTKQLRELNVHTSLAAVRNSSETLVRVAQVHPDLLPTWQAAAELVSYRSELMSAKKNLPDCFLDQPPSTILDQVSMHFHDCTLNLNNLRGFEPYKVRVTQGNPVTAFSTVSPDITLANGVVRYAGGEIIPIAALHCYGCSFRLEPPTSVPSGNGKALSTTLLTADLEDFAIKFHASEG